MIGSTGCQCDQPGWCDRHKVKKSDRMFELCHISEKYWQSWENGVGPGQKSRGIGDTTAKIIQAVSGGRIQPCGSCNKRKNFLNKLLPYRSEDLYQPITKRNLIYHIYPKPGFEELVEEIAKHRKIFNGKVVVAIAVDEISQATKFDSTVEKLLNPHTILHCMNCSQVRETGTFSLLLRKVLNDNPETATFYCHTKANSTDDNKQGATRWRQVMVDRLLAHWSDAMEHLKRYTFVGTHKMIWSEQNIPPYPTRLRAKHQWMHAGTFWWFRNDRVHGLHSPESIPWDRYAVEAWPSQLIPHEEAYSMWQPWGETEEAYPQRSPYDPRLYDHDYSK